MSQNDIAAPAVKREQRTFSKPKKQFHAKGGAPQSKHGAAPKKKSNWGGKKKF